MNAILFTTDFEPITVIDLPMWAHEMALKHRYVRVAVMEPPKCHVNHNEEFCELKIVTIMAERLIWRDRSEKIIYVTADEEVALLLKSSFLPGQINEVNQREKSAFVQGMLATLQGMR